MRRGGSRSGIFLMELIIAVLFFSVCAAMCLRLFAAAKIMSDGSAELNRAVSAASSVAECWKRYGTLEGVRGVVGGTVDGDTLEMLEGGLTTRVTASGGYAYIDVTDEDGESVYTLRARAVSQ